MLDWLRRDGDSSNTTIGIILLVMLLVFIGPNVLPSILSRSVAFIDEGVPCSRLREAENRGFHQSLIGRATQNPLTLRVDSATLPTTPDGSLLIRMTIENNTIGSIPIVFDEGQIIVGDDPTSSGFGLIFNPPVNLRLSGIRQTQSGIIPESSIRMLGPRQRCVHRITFPANTLDQALYSGTITVSAYYRILTNGIIQTPNAIYPDHGLAIIQGNFLLSEPEVIPVAPATATAG